MSFRGAVSLADDEELEDSRLSRRPSSLVPFEKSWLAGLDSSERVTGGAWLSFELSADASADLLMGYVVVKMERRK
jgi:hypothetical protein